MNATRLPARGEVTTVSVNSTQYEMSTRIAVLNELTAQQLRDEWRRLRRGQPPRLSRDLLIRTIAYRMAAMNHQINPLAAHIAILSPHRAGSELRAGQ